MLSEQDIVWIGSDGPAPRETVHGSKAALLAVAAKAGLPVPAGFVIPAEAGAAPLAALSRLEALEGATLGDPEHPLLLSVRPSAPLSAGSVAPAVLDIGVTTATLPALARKLGERTAHDLHRRALQSFGAGALGVSGEDFEYALHDALRLAGTDAESDLDAAQLASLAATCAGLIEDEAGEPMPDDAHAQLERAIAGLAAGWTSRRARNRRLAMGHDPDQPLWIIVQAMRLGVGSEACGAGFAEFRDEATGEARLGGRYLTEAQGEEARMGLRTPRVLTRGERETLGLHDPSLEEMQPGAVATLRDIGAHLEHAIGDAIALEFTIERGALNILEVRRARRTPKAAIQIAVDLAETGAIGHEDALMRVDPAHIEEQLHPAIDPTAQRHIIGHGLAASPGGACGPLVFSPDEAEATAARGGGAILALIETSPEDIRGMHAAVGVLTVRGGMTSHAAVVARGLGTPCVVGARDLRLDRNAATLTTADGRKLRQGDIVTVDGTTGEVLDGAVPMIQPRTSGGFATLMKWADDARRMGVRANADTAEDADTARGFGAEGIGLCRTEHMFFQHGRISAMREMILAEDESHRRAALAKLLPMQRGDFVDLFASMPGMPVTIRLLDPPLHEFLPHGEAELRDIAAALDLPVSTVAARAQDLAEFNPMLGNRGCRVGIGYPEVYEMQARAIFEAAIDAEDQTGTHAHPEIMIPFVSAVEEQRILAALITEVANAVSEERGRPVHYTVGAMVETPRACLVAGEIAAHAGFLSFGTNDLTQMLFGLSRDDAGRFMPRYLDQGVFGHDPFHSLDLKGVGEMVALAIDRARAGSADIVLGLCGEHGADPASVDFCERSGLAYVSCSPFRVPVARLAAAQATIRATARAQLAEAG